MDRGRKIIHIDMDCFYAAIEVRDNPSLRGKPVAVGATAKQRGVLCTANYEARKYGVHSAMPTWIAFEKCPHLILLPVNIRKYKSVSDSIHIILRKYTEIIEPLSLDEAFLDVTGSKLYNGSASLISEAIRRDIYESQGITASAGISFNKFLAKIASSWNKPNSQYIIRPDDSDKFISQLSIEKIHGVGKVTAKKLHDLKILTCKDLQQLDRNHLIEIIGKYGKDLYYLSRGIDNREVITSRPIKSMTVEETYETHVRSSTESLLKLQDLYDRLIFRLNATHHSKISSIFVKLKFTDFTQTTIERRALNPDIEIFNILLSEGTRRKNLDVRLIGIGVRFRDKVSNSNQLEFAF